MRYLRDGAEDGIRTRDPHLGKVFEFVHGVLASPLNWPPVCGTSSESARIQPCCRAIYYEVGPFDVLRAFRSTYNGGLPLELAYPRAARRRVLEISWVESSSSDHSRNRMN